MKPLAGIDIRRAATQLQWPERQLRAWLVQRGAIRKTAYGYETAPAWRGLLTTQTRQHIVTTECGQRITRYYSVALVTGDGLAWLRDARAQQQPIGGNG